MLSDGITRGINTSRLCSVSERRKVWLTHFQLSFSWVILQQQRPGNWVPDAQQATPSWLPFLQEAGAVSQQAAVRASPQPSLCSGRWLDVHEASSQLSGLILSL